MTPATHPKVRRSPPAERRPNLATSVQASITPARRPRLAVRSVRVPSSLAHALVPDLAQQKLYQEAVAPTLKSGAMLLFSHGFNIHYKQIEPATGVDVALVASSICL